MQKLVECLKELEDKIARLEKVAARLEYKFPPSPVGDNEDFRDGIGTDGIYRIEDDPDPGAYNG